MWRLRSNLKFRSHLYAVHLNLHYTQPSFSSCTRYLQFHALQPCNSLYFLHAVLNTYLKVPTRRIYLRIKSFVVGDHFFTSRYCHVLFMNGESWSTNYFACKFVRSPAQSFRYNRVWWIDWKQPFIPKTRTSLKIFSSFIFAGGPLSSSLCSIFWLWRYCETSSLQEVGSDTSSRGK